MSCEVCSFCHCLAPETLSRTVWKQWHLYWRSMSFLWKCEIVCRVLYFHLFVLPTWGIMFALVCVYCSCYIMHTAAFSAIKILLVSSLTMTLPNIDQFSLIFTSSSELKRKLESNIPPCLNLLLFYIWKFHFQLYRFSFIIIISQNNVYSVTCSCKLVKIEDRRCFCLMDYFLSSIMFFLHTASADIIVMLLGSDAC